MEAFQLLSRGGACFDKQRFKSDVQLFTVSGRLVGRPWPFFLRLPFLRPERRRESRQISERVDNPGLEAPT